MFRLTVLLCAGLFVTLLVAGEDRGQMRPGLAKAVAEGQDIVVLERRRAAPVQPAAVAAEPAVIAAAFTPDPAPPVPEPAARKVTPAPVFTLSALPSLGGDKVEVAETLPEATPEAVPLGSATGGEIWYVTASSVNVREDPSTEAYVLGKLAAGEAVTVIAMADSEWAQIIIEGDGIEGYVATRFLSPVAP
ncbi:SH3 domain-containing protein [Rhodobacter sp. Har01]|uniref:SH3 domain-containing protein n=1 Tax=Rhodobacter sp. Har01 TaxID=2883999 RepID=UPI001D0660B2|nr:SH3 domain-containing protein [Rhodobacter sp. Har01]MCB6177635.1 SH3 domain-containing protein [Rhodobacter sp. Har01]